MRPRISPTPSPSDLRSKCETPQRPLATAKATTKSLQTRLEIPQNFLKGQQARTNNPPQPDAISDAKSTDAKNNYLLAKQQLESAKTRLESERRQLEIVSVKVWQKAEP